MNSPLTVAQLIEHLSTLDPSIPVMIECEDGHYNGPLTTESLVLGCAVLTDRWGWRPIHEDESAPESTTERWPALLIQAGFDF